MRTTLLLLTSLALAACQRTAPVTADEAAPASSVRTPPEKADPHPAGVATLEGHWRVAGIDGAALDEPVAIALTASDRQIWWEPRCAGMARNYRIEGGTIRFTSTLPARAPGEPTPPVCAIGLPPRLGEVFRALDEATGIARLPSNGIRIAGPKHDVTIFAQ
jgi:hypothetical protein